MLKPLLLLFTVFSCTLSLATESVIKVIPINNRSASELQQLITPLIEDSERVIAGPSNLIIRATPSRQREIQSLIKQLDTQLSNLSITVIQSKTKTAAALNASASVNLKFARNKSLQGSSRIRGHYANTEDFSNTDSRQKIQTLNGKPAYIKTGKTYPIQNTSIYNSPYGYPVISSDTHLIEASTGFQVIPRLSGKQVTLEVSPWSDKMNKNGVLSSQSGHSTIRVKLGQWVEIGGIDQQSQHTKNRVFSHTYSTKNKSMRILIKVEKMQ